VKKNNHSALNFIVSITLFTVFALALTLVLLTGASAFRGISAESEERFNERTPLLYLSNRLRDADSVTIGEIDGTQVLAINYDLYDVYIYEYGGFICESATAPGDVPRLDMGFRLFAVEELEFLKDSDTLAQVIVNGRSIFVNVAVVMEG